MNSQLVFALVLLITLGMFSFTTWKYFQIFKLTKPAFPVKNLRKRFHETFVVAFAQSKMFRKPFSGFLHALVFWGFLVILIGSIEMVIDGLWGIERSLRFLGWFYDLAMASGDIFALVVAISILIFLGRRILIRIERFEGAEMKMKSHWDAKLALTMILLLMVTLLGINASYVAYQTANQEQIFGVYPVSNLLAGFMDNLSPQTMYLHHEVHWWGHILLIFAFANILPYSKHFHVFMSIPNVFLSQLDPLGKLNNMDNVTREVKLILDPATAYAAAPTDTPPERFGVMDVEDISWKNYLDSLACTECGRCTSVCPASVTGKKLSPRKIIMDVRARMREKTRGLSIAGKLQSDSKNLLRDYVSTEEIWACTTCNACAMECPVNINHPRLIVDMRRYLVMEEGSAPGEIKAMFNNIENNGAPWQYSPEDRLRWAGE